MGSCAEDAVCSTLETSGILFVVITVLKNWFLFNFTSVLLWADFIGSKNLISRKNLGLFSKMQ